MPKSEKLILLDASAIIHRAFHALPPLTDRSGRLVNAAYGFSLILLKILNEIKPKCIVAAFDSPKPTFRHKEFVEYKAKRIKKGDELYSQFSLIKEILASFSIPVYEVEGFEADDIIATIADKLKAKDIETIIVTGDLDTLQLVDKNTKVYAMRRGLTDIITYDQNKVLERYGFSPNYITDFKGLAGDASDNIPGIKGIGEKVASDLIKKCGDLKCIYQNLDDHPGKVRQLLEQGKDSAFFSKRLATLVKNVPIKFHFEECNFGDFDIQKVANLFYKFDFKSLIPRLPKAHTLQSNLLRGNNEATTESDRIDGKLEPVLREMEKTGVLIDISYLKELSKKVDSKISSLKIQIYQMVGGEFNLDSPRQLAQILFVRLGLKIQGIKKTKTGISTAASELMKLQGAHHVIDLILKYRELSKLKNTYLDTLPKLADKNSRVHTTYTQDTQTGRLASKNPNMQNIPIKSKLGNEVRKAFIAQSGYKLLAADYSQIELRIIAHLSKEPRLIFAFKKGLDIHEAVSKTLGVDRRTAKVINFGIIYGMSSHGLSETLGIPYFQAQDYIDKFFEVYPKLRDYITRCIETASQKGYLETLLCRRRYLPEIKSPIQNTKSAAERMAINFPCQGGSADILKLAMVRLHKELKVVSPKTKLILTVHDELVFETPEKEIKKVAKIVKKIMENIYKLDVPLVVEISIGKNWGEMVKLK